MKITVMGGGNIGTLMAAELASKGHRVTMLTSDPGIWQNRIEVYDAADQLILHGELENITDDIGTAVWGQR